MVCSNPPCPPSERVHDNTQRVSCSVGPRHRQKIKQTSKRRQTKTRHCKRKPGPSNQHAQRSLLLPKINISDTYDLISPTPRARAEAPSGVELLAPQATLSGNFRSAQPEQLSHAVLETQLAVP